MIAVHFEPLAKDSSLHWVYCATPNDAFGLARSPFDDTNTPDSVPVPAPLPARTRVERGLEYALTHYEDLLRKLAD